MKFLKPQLYEDIKCGSFWRAVAGEFIATALLLFIGCSAINNSMNDPDAPPEGPSSADIVKIALTFGLTVLILVNTFGPISGCHINPAASIAFFLVGKASLIRAAFYIVAQLVGSIVGMALLYGILPPKYRDNLGNANVNVDKGVSLAQGFGSETINTFILVLVISACIDDQPRERAPFNTSIHLSIGMAIGVMHLAAIPFAGAFMNPARAFGPAVISGKWENHWVYWAGPILGAVGAALIYFYLLSPGNNVSEADENANRGQTSTPTIKVSDVDVPMEQVGTSNSK